VTTVATFPRSVERLDPVWIPLKDGTRLAARIWRPVDAESIHVPAILEYIPYRRRDQDTFELEATLEALEGDALVHEQRWERSIPRDLV
jgi:predicted acyl esterase